MSVNVAPKALFRSTFRNISGRDVWVAFVPPWGRTIKAGDVFSVPGDPRYADDPNAWPRKSTIAQKLIENGVLEFLESPLSVIDNRAADGKSLTIVGDDRDLFITDTVTPADEAAARVLPILTPIVTYDSALEQFKVDWSDFSDEYTMEDTFIVRAECPDKTTVDVKAHRDKSVTFDAKAGLGEYIFTVILTAIDGRIQEGVPVSETIA